MMNPSMHRPTCGHLHQVHLVMMATLAQVLCKDAQPDQMYIR